MISLLYSIIVAFCILFLVTILLNSIEVSKSTLAGKIYIIFLAFAILFGLLDFLWGLIFSLFCKNEKLLYVITYTNLFAASAAVFGWVIFSFSFVGKKIKKNIFLFFFFLIYIFQNVVLIIDISRGDFFTLKNSLMLNNDWNRDLYFFIHFFMFSILFVINIVDLIREKKQEQRKYISTLLFISLIPLSSSILQNKYTQIPIYTMGITFASILVYSRIITYETSKILAKYQNMKYQLDYQERQRRDLSIISSLSGQFDFVCLVNSLENSIKPIRISGIFKKYFDSNTDNILNTDFDAMLKSIILEESFNDFLKNVDRWKIMPLLNNGERLAIEFSSNESCDFHHYKISFVKDLDCADIILIGIKDIEKEYRLRKELETQKTYITDLEARHEIAMYMASIDGLTGLLNKISFIEKVERYIAEKTSIGSALIFFDMDHFKSINDIFGHDKGDEALKVMATRLKALFRPNELIARMGGDEFSVFLPNISKDVLEKRLMEMNKKLKDVYANSSVTIKTSASIGCIYCVKENLTYVELHQGADKAMYEVKNSGRNNFIIKEV